MLGNFAFFFGGNRENNNPLGFIGVLIAMIVAPLAAMLVQMAISRTREYSADRRGAEICGNPLWLSSALRKIAGAAQVIHNNDAERNPATAHMFIINPLSGERMDNLFSTHPNTENRVAALERMARETSTGSTARSALIMQGANRALSREPAGVAVVPNRRKAPGLMPEDNKNDSRPKRSREHNRSGAAGARPGADAAAKPGLKSRQAAAKILAAVVDRKTPLDGMLDPERGNPAYRELSEADRALVRAILNSALRHLPRIRAAIDSLLQTPLPEGARALEHVLTVAAAQILYLDVPDHSAVDLAVEQAQSDPRNRRFASLVNAVLRRLSVKRKKFSKSCDKSRRCPAGSSTGSSPVTVPTRPSASPRHSSYPPLST